jgi:hypothetical protein
VGAETPADVAEVSGRLYELDPSGNLVERSIPQSGGPQRAVPLSPVTEQGIALELERAGAGRTADLVDPAHAPTVARLVPEDFTRRAHVFHVAIEHYTDAAFAELFARVGQIEGFSVVARVAAGTEWAEYLWYVPSLTVIELPGAQYLWTEDVLEIGVDGTFQMTARMGDRGMWRRALFVDRLRRYYPQVKREELEEISRLPTPPDELPGLLPIDVMRRFSDIMFMNQGLVEREGGQPVAAALAALRGAKLREAVTYLEGGNVLLGTLPDGRPYALVGRDSAAVSRTLLERQRGTPVAEADVVTAMARDLGVAPELLFLVEQPGVFHLDMAMTLLTPGTVVLNDAMEAFRLQTTWLREDYEAWRPQRGAFTSEADYLRKLELWREAGRIVDATIASLWKYTERFIRYEARTLADLEAAGLKVLRVPGRFPHPARAWELDIMNFLNGEAGTSPSGRTYFITQGGDPRAERYVAAKLLAPGTGLHRLYMAPRLASRDSLWEKGGTACRVKVEGEVRAGR